MISPTAFRDIVDTLCVKYAGSVTSGRRTFAHNKQVGGLDHGPHVWGAGIDVVWDAGKQPDGLAAEALDHGVMAINEYLTGRNHTHMQPANWPAGPVTTPPVSTVAWERT